MNRFLFELKFTVPVLSRDRWEARKLLQQLIESKAKFDLESVEVLKEDKVEFVNSNKATGVDEVVAVVNEKYIALSDLK